MRPARRLALLASLTGVAALWLAPGAQAEFGIVPGSFAANTHGPLATAPPTGSLVLSSEAEAQQWREDITAAPTVEQAGAHPDASTVLALNEREDECCPLAGGVPDGNARDIAVDLPAGFIGNPQAMPTCSRDDFSTERNFAGDTNNSCPTSTQVGIATTTLLFGTIRIRRILPVYNIEPPPGAPAAFGFSPVGQSIVLEASVRSDSDYGVTITLTDIPTVNPLYSGTVTIWGVPADPIHDVHRWDNEDGGWEASLAGVQRRPFLSNPTFCDSGPLMTTIRARSWQNPGTWIEDSDTAPEPAGCDLLAFDRPGAAVELTAQPDTGAADSPSGLEFRLRMPFNDDPDGLARPTLRDAVVRLPDGMAINPSAAGGLGACSPAQIGLDSLSPPSCPDASKLGTVGIDTPLLEDPLQGSVFQAEQDRNPFNSTFAIYLHAQGSGVQVKLAGEITPDPETGQLTATFLDNPQLPFTELTVRFKSGPRAPLVTPPTLGTKTTTTELTPWSAPHSGPPATPSSSFQITSGPNGTPGAQTMAARPFGLGFTAGVRNPQAASRSPFTVRVSRPDGHQEIETLDVELPQGLAASLRGVPLCEERDAANANCGPASQIGTVQAAAGAGSSPFWITDGKVFLTGPYKGAPLGLSVVVPAVAGPFDLGEVAVRAALFVDKTDAHITVQSDPIPQILEGVPLRVREMRIRIDRPNFALAGTSCDESQVSAEANGISGASTQLAERFQLAGCRGLGFRPKFRFKAIGKRSTPRLAHPRLRAVVRPKPKAGSNANISRAKVTLPRGIELDQSNLARPCTRPQFAQDACPNRTKVGRAIARSPLLPEPLRGPVFIVTSDNELPDLLADLNGIVDIDLRGRIDTTGRTERIRNTFELVPDVPVRRFKLNLKGGPRRGLLINSTDRCENRRQNRIKVGTRAHNGRSANQRPLMRVKQCKKRKKRG